MTVLGRVCLQSLEAGLSILEYTCALVKYDVRLINDGTVIPFAVFEISHISLVGNLISETQVSPIDVLFFYNSFPPDDYLCKKALHRLYTRNRPDVNDSLDSGVLEKSVGQVKIHLLIGFGGYLPLG